jgi:hypothetical protein
MTPAGGPIRLPFSSALQGAGPAGFFPVQIPANGPRAASGTAKPEGFVPGNEG